jgi:hypothetical protein
MYNASERKDVRRAEKDFKIAERQRQDAIRGIMSVVGGREWMWGLLSRCHVFTSSFNPQALAMAFAEGERNVGLQLVSDIMEIAPDSYVLMMREANDREYARNHSRSGRDREDADGGFDGEDGADSGDGEDRVLTIEQGERR